MIRIPENCMPHVEIVMNNYKKCAYLLYFVTATPLIYTAPAIPVREMERNLQLNKKS